jgi:hypothetical protein
MESLKREAIAASHFWRDSKIKRWKNLLWLCVQFLALNGARHERKGDAKER